MTLHVDDLNSTADSATEGFDFYQQAKNCLKNGGFNLRKLKLTQINFEK